ncbi:MAG: TonB-dependent receptor, partial [Gammaproteobacteria bacterium]|nr:TonB-dependent receptor [Gammaproteobacteria bacterium]
YAPWLSTDATNWKQTAIFGEFTWHINDKTDLTMGGRYFKRDNDKLYLVYTPTSHRASDYLEGSDASKIASGSDSDFVPKINLSYQLSDNKMLYALYTEGFRPGGTNRRRGDEDRMAFPRVYEADNVANYEIGAKTRWLDNSLQLNMSYFHMLWTDFQLEVLEPSNAACTEEETVICDQPWQIVVANAGEAHTTGFQAEMAWVPAEGWEIGGNLQLLEAEVDDDFPAGDVTAGMKLPNVPEKKGSAWLSHNWDVTFVQEGEMFFRVQYSYNGESNNILEATANDANPLMINRAYSIVDLSLGLISHANGWEAKFYINNATDERAEYFNNTGLFELPFSRTDEYSNYHRLYTNRPMEYGVRFKYAWGD